MTQNTEWIKVHDDAMTNIDHDSNIDITLDTTPMCSNMTDGEFKELIVRLRTEAAALIQNRINCLNSWDKVEKDRIKKWFGRVDDSVRIALNTGLPKLLDAMRNLKSENIIRWDKQKQRNITCTVLPDTGMTDAAVCKPDSAKRIIAIYPHFCTSPNSNLWKECKVLTLIHECTHFVDVFDSNDEMYGVGIGLSFWAQSNPDKAIRNADSITCYVGYED